jgi:hypothetical protein
MSKHTEHPNYPPAIFDPVPVTLAEAAAIMQSDPDDLRVPMLGLTESGYVGERAQVEPWRRSQAISGDKPC